MSKQLWMLGGVTIVALVLRLPGLGNFMSADEPNWMIRSSQFYHAIFRDWHPHGTFITSHPGATAMWIIGAGEFIQEQRLGFDVDEGTLKHFRLAATLPMAAVTAFLISIAAWQITKLWGLVPALVAGILLAADPYLTGISQIAHLDALLALLMLNAVLAFLLFSPPYEEGVPANAGGVVTGLFTGLALATKLLPAAWLLVFFALVLLPKKNTRRFFFIAGIAVLTLYITWPALWVKADIGNTLQRDIPSVIQDEHVQQDASEPTSPAAFYLRTILGRTTPWVLILAGVSIILLPLLRGRPGRGFVIWLLLYTLGYLILISLAAKKADRYALPALVVLPVLAGWAIAKLATSPYLKRGRPPIWRVGEALVAVFIILYPLLLSPHAIAYNNPFFPNIRPLHQQGWGEGLEAAAAWLNQHPLAGKLTIASWYPSVMGTYFSGKTLSLSSRDDARVGYVIIYRNMGGRGEDDQATAVLAEFSSQTPAQVISIQNIPHVWIYDTIGLPYFDRHTDELIGERQIGQTIPVTKNNWNMIDFGLATFSSRNNTEDVVLHVRENPSSQTDIRTASLNARQILDSDWNRFSFEPIANSAEKTFYIVLESPTSQPGNAVAIRYATTDIRPGEMYSNSQVRAADIAYRIP